MVGRSQKRRGTGAGEDGFIAGEAAYRQKGDLLKAGDLAAAAQEYRQAVSLTPAMRAFFLLGLRFANKGT